MEPITPNKIPGRQSCPECGNADLTNNEGDCFCSDCGRHVQLLELDDTEVTLWPHE